MRRTVLVILATLSILLAGVSSVRAVPPTDPPGQGECDHGNSLQSCRPDPQPSAGQDCDQHGNPNGGVNEDHCGPTEAPSSTPSSAPSSAPSASPVVVDPTPSAAPSTTPSVEPSAEPTVRPSPTTGPVKTSTPSASPATSPRPSAPSVAGPTAPPTDTAEQPLIDSYGFDLPVVAVGVILLAIAAAGYEIGEIKRRRK